MSYFSQEHETGAALIDQALVLNSNLAVAWRFRGIVCMRLGQHERGIESLTHSLRLNPLDPQIWSVELFMAYAHLFLGDLAKANEWSAKALRRQPDWMAIQRLSIVCDVRSGYLAGARKKMSRLRQIDPALRMSNLKDVLPYQRAEDVALIIDALRLAGLPE